MKSSILQVNSLKKSFSGTPVLLGIDLEIASGETVAVMGPSGSGKSTLLRCINCLEHADGGSIILDGEVMGYKRERKGNLRRLTESQLATQRRSVGMVFQGFNLFPHWTVLRNIADGPRSVLRMSPDDANRCAMTLLERVGLADRANAYPRQLSGGQQQRVAIARTLALGPALLLFDEPTSALDPANVGEVIDVMNSLSSDGSTMMVVTHELGFARAAADRVVFMDQGEIVEQGSPAQVLDNPTDPRTKRFLCNVLD